MFDTVRAELTGSRVVNVGASNRRGERQAMLFLEDQNGRQIRVCVPMAEVEEALASVPRKPVLRSTLSRGERPAPPVSRAG